MIINYKYKDYDTRYWSGSRKRRAVCFAEGCREGLIGDYYFITYDIPRKQREYSYCYLNQTELINYIKELSILLGYDIISISITETRYLVQIRMPSSSRLFLYISTFIRYTYEYPYNFLLYCALNNRSNFPLLNITHIIQFYITMFSRPGYGHAIGDMNYTFRNINSKCQYNLLYNSFNGTRTLAYTTGNYKCIMSSVLVKMNTKQFDYIKDSINLLANKCYKEYEESICSWK